MLQISNIDIDSGIFTFRHLIVENFWLLIDQTWHVHQYQYVVITNLTDAVNSTGSLYKPRLISTWEPLFQFQHHQNNSEQILCSTRKLLKNFLLYILCGNCR
jgi:hypothetical protein